MKPNPTMGNAEVAKRFRSSPNDGFCIGGGGFVLVPAVFAIIVDPLSSQDVLVADAAVADSCLVAVDDIDLDILILSRR